jgi:hypothetical protein
MCPAGIHKGQVHFTDPYISRTCSGVMNGWGLMIGDPPIAGVNPVFVVPRVIGVTARFRE